MGSSSTVNNNLTQKPLQVLIVLNKKTDVRVRVANAPRLHVHPQKNEKKQRVEVVPGTAVTLVGMLVPAATACLLFLFRTQILSGEFRESTAWCFCRPPCCSPASEAFSTTCGGTWSSLATSPESTVHLRHEVHVAICGLNTCIRRSSGTQSLRAADWNASGPRRRFTDCCCFESELVRYSLPSSVSTKHDLRRSSSSSTAITIIVPELRFRPHLWDSKC